MGTTFHTVTITTLNCWKCACVFGINEATREARVEDHEAFYCTNGHANYYNGETAKQRAEKAAQRAQELLAQERERTTELRERVARKERQLSAAAGRITRIKNRVAAGVCPCCNRTFENLARHMKGQHPDFTHAEAKTN